MPTNTKEFWEKEKVQAEKQGKTWTTWALWTTTFQELAYNICGVNTTIYQPIKIKRFKVIHNIHKPDSIQPCALFLIVHNAIHNLSTYCPQTKGKHLENNC